MSIVATSNPDVKNKVQHVCDRLGFHITRGDLGSLLGVTSRSIEHFKDRINVEVEKNPALLDVIDEYWTELTISGNKITKIYSFRNARDNLSKIRDYIYTVKANEKLKFWEKYPYPLDEAELLKCDNRQCFASVTPYTLHDRTIDVALLLSAETYTATFDVKPEHLTDSGKELLRASVEMIYKQRAVTQCYNTVIVDMEKELLIISVDYSKLPRSETSRQFAGLYRFISKAGVPVPEPLNLFRAINPLYTRPDGRISMVSFLTADGNTSSLRLKADQECLKLDSYHHGGELASGVITKFKIHKLWNMKLQGGYESPIGVELLGKKIMLDDTSEKLTDALITDNTQLRHKIFIIEKLMEALR